MVRRALTMLGWGTAGIVVAAALIAGAFVVAGTRLTEPATPIRVAAPRLVSDSRIAQPADGVSTSPSPAPTSVGVTEPPPGPSTHSTAPGSDDGNGNRDDGGRGGDSDGDD